MVLALGYQAAPDHTLGSTEQPMEGWTERFLDAAQFFFSRSPYLSAPTLTSVRTLCLVLIARILELKGAETSQPTSLAGILTRTAMVIHLHRTPSALPGVTRFDAEMRNRLWTTVQLLDLQVAMGTGTTYTHEDHDYVLPLLINNADIYRTQHGWMVDGQRARSHEVTDSTFQIKLAEALPVLVELINNVNTPTKPPPTYDRVQAWDSQVRQQLRDAESALNTGPRSVVPPETIKTQLNFLRILTHRTLLGLHHHHTTTPLFQQHPDSTSAVISSALEILRIHQTWRRQPPPLTTAQPGYPPGPLIPPPSTQTWLLDLIRDSATAAALYLILALRRLSLGQISPASIPLLSPPEQQQPPPIQQQQPPTPSQLLPQPPQPPHQIQPTTPHAVAAAATAAAAAAATATDAATQPNLAPTLALTNTMHQALAAFRSRAGKSAAHFEDYVTTSIAAGCLEALPSSSGGTSGSGTGTGAGSGLGAGSGSGSAGKQPQQQQQQQRVMGVLLGVAEQIEQTVAGFVGTPGQGLGPGQGGLWAGEAGGGGLFDFGSG